MEACAPAIAAEISELLCQCTPEELSNILQTIEGVPPLPLGSADVAESAEEAAAQNEISVAIHDEPQAPLPAAAALAAATEWQTPPAAQTRQEFAAAAPLAPAPPAGQPGNVRRPNPRVAKRSEGDGVPEASPASARPQGEAVAVREEVQRTLGGADVPTAPDALTERARPMGDPRIPGGVFASAESVDVHVLTQALLERDREVNELEARLADLHAELLEKERRASDLGAEWESTFREVRHRQLDLEFQQLKLEERVRGNAELEQTHRSLSVRVEEAALTARHNALDLDISRSMTTPRGLRAQGSLPWMLRKNRMDIALVSPRENMY